MLQNRRNVRRDKVFALAETHDKRTVFSHRNDFVGFVLADNAESVASLNNFNGFNNRVKKVSVIVFSYKLCQNLCIGFRHKLNALFYKFCFKGRIIFNNTVVNNADFAVIRKMRMRIYVGRRTVRCPARMTYTHTSVKFYSPALFRKVFELTFRLYRGNFSVQHRNTGRIVSAVFKLGKSVKQNLFSIAFANIANYSAHIKFSFHCIKIITFHKGDERF